MEQDPVFTSLEIPAALHQQLQEAAVRLGCSVQTLILQSIERLIAEEASTIKRRVQLPLVPAAGREIRPMDNDEAIFS